MNSLKPRAPFQVLVMSEESRLGRESIETGWSLKQIMDAGVRVAHGNLAAQGGGRLAEWRAMLDRQPIQPRQILRKLLEGRFTLTPRKDATGRSYDYAGQASYGRLLTGIVVVRADRELVVPPG